MGLKIEFSAKYDSLRMLHCYMILCVVVPNNPYSKLPDCDARSKYRTIDGTCNNIRSPWHGAAKIPLVRMSNIKYEDGKLIITRQKVSVISVCFKL